MKKKIFLFLSVTLLFFAACKKKESTPGPDITRVGTIYDDSSHTNTLYYYSPSRLIKGDYDDSGRFNYAYHYGNSQSVTDVQLNYMPAYTLYYIWNSRSLVDSSNVLNVNGGIGIRKKYTYDANNFLTGVQWYNDINTMVLTESFTISNGNIIQHSYNILDTANSSLPHGTYTYTYYSGEKNTLSNFYFGQAYLGASSANPVKSSTYSYGSTTFTTDYTYNYTNGYITSELVYADSSGVSTRRVDSLSYSYYFW